jgi:hypothetical protein
MMPPSAKLHPTPITGAFHSTVALRSRAFVGLALIGCLLWLLDGALRSTVALRSQAFLALALIGCLLYLLHFTGPILSDAAMWGNQLAEQGCDILYSLIPVRP